MSSSLVGSRHERRFLLSSAVLFAMFLAWSVYYQSLESLPFSSRAWQQPDSVLVHSMSARQRMLDDLVSRTALEGMGEDSVIKLFGQPSQTRYYHDWSMEYWLGPEHGTVGVTTKWLVLRVDSTGHVSGHAVKEEP